MELNLIKENPDGSADYSVNMSDEEQRQLMRFAFIEMFKRGMEEGKQYDPEQCELSVGNTGCGKACGKDGACEQSCKSGQ